MARLERCVVISTEKKVYHNLRKNEIVIADATESQVQYAMRSSYNSMIIIAENYKERERIMRKAERSEDFANKVIDSEEQRMMF